LKAGGRRSQFAIRIPQSQIRNSKFAIRNLPFSVNESPLPDLEVDETPKPFCVILSCAVSRHELAHKLTIEDATRLRSLAE